MGDARRGYSLMKLIGREGKKVDIVPKWEKIKGTCPTELYTKGFEYLGLIIYDMKWKKWVLFDLDKKMQMSKGCLDEAFKLTKEYWEKENVA